MSIFSWRKGSLNYNNISANVVMFGYIFNNITGYWGIETGITIWLCFGTKAFIASVNLNVISKKKKKITHIRWIPAWICLPLLVTWCISYISFSLLIDKQLQTGLMYAKESEKNWNIFEKTFKCKGDIEILPKCNTNIWLQLILH